MQKKKTHKPTLLNVYVQEDFIMDCISYSIFEKNILAGKNIDKNVPAPIKNHVPPIIKWLLPYPTIH